MSDADRELLARVHHDVAAALASARKLWADDAGEETLLHTAEAFLVHLRELRRTANGSTPPAAPAEPAPSCPLCQTPMKDHRTTKRGNQPDFKCPMPGCDGAVWLERAKRR